MSIKIEQLIQPLKPVGRKWRRPKHRFQVSHKPYQIQPFMLAPVLPGDTLKTASFQARVVTDPIKNPLVGWHQEYYFFYVKLTDLEIRDQIPEMFLDPAFDPTGLNAAANTKTYHAGGGIDWVAHAMQRCVAEYFRDEGEAWDVATLDGLALAQCFGREDAWTDSLMQDDDAPETPVADEDMGAVYGEQYAKWEAMAKLKLTNLTFEEYLERAYGVAVEAENNDQHKPELLRYVRDWSYPSNTVDPTTGTPSSAVSWSIAERLDKNRFFKEPGFVLGLTVTRPKVYMANQKGSASQLLNKGERWLPSIVLGTEPHASVVNVPTGTGPLPNITDDGGYWVDLVDLFMYGEQFLSYTTTDAGLSTVSLPSAAGSTKYASSADIDALFKSAASNKVRQDGIVDLRILSRIADTTR